VGFIVVTNVQLIKIRHMFYQLTLFNRKQVQYDLILVLIKETILILINYFVTLLTMIVLCILRSVLTNRLTELPCLMFVLTEELKNAG